MGEKIDMNDILNNNTFNEGESDNLGGKNSKKLKLLCNEEPEIVFYGKACATGGGDFISSFIESMHLKSRKMSDEIREYSIECTSPLLPDLENQQTSGSLYERSIVPINFPSNEHDIIIPFGK